MVIIKSIKLSSDGIIYQYKYRLREEFFSTQPNYYWTFTTNLKLWMMISFLTFNSQDLSAQPASAQCICWTWSWLCSIREHPIQSLCIMVIPSFIVDQVFILAFGTCHIFVLEKCWGYLFWERGNWSQPFLWYTERYFTCCH